MWVFSVDPWAPQTQLCTQDSHPKSPKETTGGHGQWQDEPGEKAENRGRISISLKHCKNMCDSLKLFFATWVHVVCHVLPFPWGGSLTSWPRFARSLGRDWRQRGFVKYTACVEPWSVIIMNFHGNEPLTTEFLLVFGDQEKPCPSYYGKDEDKKKVQMVLQQEIHPDVRAKWGNLTCHCQKLPKMRLS